MATSKNSKKINYKFPDWIKESSLALKPPEHLSVSDWADKYRKLNAKTSLLQGNWQTSNTPYLKEIMDFISSSSANEIVLVKGSQLGGTEAVINMTGWLMSQSPCPTMIVYPTETLAISVVKNRLKPLNSLSLSEVYDFENSELTEQQYINGAVLYLAWAGSASALSSKPCRCVFFDEVDKYPVMAKGDADPIKLGEERTKTFSYKAKIVKLSTPTFESGHIWRAFKRCEEIKHFYVKCPHCNEQIIFLFDNIKWDVDWSFQEIKDKAFYRCQKCGEKIETSQKTELIQNGEWIGENEVSNPVSIGYQISSIYSPFLKFGDVAVKFLQSKNNYTELMNFVNGWLAEPFKEDATENKVSDFINSTTSYDKWQVPKWTEWITAGIDVQKNARLFYYAIRAWGTRGYSSLIAEGTCSSFEELDDLISSSFICPDTGRVFNGVNLAAIDSGYMTDLVYDFAAEREDFVVPVKGDDRVPADTPYIISAVRRPAGKTKGNGLRLYRLNVILYKTQMMSRIARGINESGSWNVYRGVSEKYAHAIFSEVPERDIKTRKVRWVKKYAGIENHYLDCEVYNIACADLLDVWSKGESVFDKTIDEQQKESSFILERSWF